MRVSPRSLGLLVAFLAVGAIGQAAAKPEPMLDTIADEFEQAAGNWEKGITAYALRLFYLLATLDVVWTGLSIALKGSGLQEFVAELVRRLLFIGFFLALLLNAHDWSRAIVNSFQMVGAQAVRESVGPELPAKDFGPDGELKPSAIAAKGVLYSRRITNSAPGIMVHPGGAVFFGFAALCVLTGFSAIAARQVLVLAEMYIVLSAGVLLLGFGASRWTNDFAGRYLRYCVSVGAKLMFIQISVALSLHFLNGLLSSSSHISFTRAATLTMSLSVLVVLIWTIPNIVAQFMQGVSATSGSELMGVGQLGRTAFGSAAPTTGGSSLRQALTQAVLAPMRAGAGGALGNGTSLGTGMGRPLGAIGSRLAGKPASTHAGARPSGVSGPGGGDTGGTNHPGNLRNRTDDVG